MTKLVLRWLLIFLLVGISFSIPALALQVKALKPSGILQLDSGKEACFAGLLIPSESLPLLSVLLAQKDLEFDVEKSAEYQISEMPQAGYFYVKTFEMDFPFHPGDKPKETKIMVNELLLSLGLARVDLSKNFKHRDKFLEIEAAAKNRGMGVWSYETPPAASIL